MTRMREYPGYLPSGPFRAVDRSAGWEFTPDPSGLVLSETAGAG